MAIVLNTPNLSYGNGVVMVSSPKQQDNRTSPKQLPGIGQMLSIFVADLEEHYQKSIANNVQILRDLNTED